MRSTGSLLLIFLAGCSYGILSTFVKIAYGEGFQASEVIGVQNYFGWVMLLVLVLLFARRKVERKSLLLLLTVGMNTGLTGVLYYQSLKTTPASIAIVLLFQFTWIGIIIEAIADRKFPSREKLLAIPLLFIGSLIAGGVFEGDKIILTPAGVMFGLLSAVTFAFFIFFSGRVATHVPALNRSFIMVTGTVILLSFIFPPKFLVNGALAAGLWKYGLFLGIFGVVIPPLFFAKGTPNVGPGLASILGASELPTAILMSTLILHEFVSLYQWIGVVLILLGIALPQMMVQWRKGKVAQRS